MLIVTILFFGLLLIASLPGLKFNTGNKVQLLDKNDTNFIRGISALFVLVAHYAIQVQANTNGINSIAYALLSQLGGIGVLLFFFVSGYGINESYSDKKIDKTYLIKRFKGVYLPYIFTKYILLIISLFFDMSLFTVRDVFSILLVPDWFIFVIILQYISYYLARKYFSRNSLVFCLIANIVFTIWFVITDKPIGWYNALWLFTFGIVVSMYQDKITTFISKHKICYAFVCLFMFLAFGVVFVLFKGAAFANIFKPISGMFLSIAICCIFGLIKIDNFFSSWLGKRSLHIYIIHMFVWDILLVYVFKSMSNEKFTILTILATLISFVMTEIIYYVTTRLTNLIVPSSKTK